MAQRRGVARGVTLRGGDVTRAAASVAREHARGVAEWISVDIWYRETRRPIYVLAMADMLK